ncbi:hypothetical protein ABZ619_39255 [Streptomyces sp. NPDC007851]|uniref:hypothetical protein n=1 Tax=Streptomyces sp. NPDC007851 TaxID=3155008 RepID=UPI0034003806
MWWLAIAGAAILGGAAATWVDRQHMLRRLAQAHDQHDRDATSARAETAQLRTSFHALAAGELVTQEANQIITDVLRDMDSRGAGR